MHSHFQIPSDMNTAEPGMPPVCILFTTGEAEVLALHPSRGLCVPSSTRKMTGTSFRVRRWPYLAAIRRRCRVIRQRRLRDCVLIFQSVAVPFARRWQAGVMLVRVAKWSFLFRIYFSPLMVVLNFLEAGLVYVVLRSFSLVMVMLGRAGEKWLREIRALVSLLCVQDKLITPPASAMRC